MNQVVAKFLSLFLLFAVAIQAEDEAVEVVSEASTGTVATLVETDGDHSAAPEAEPETDASSDAGYGSSAADEDEEKVTLPDAPVNLDAFARLSVLPIRLGLRV